jgi:hypothetical protein
MSALCIVMEAGAYNRLGKEIVSGLLFPLDIHVSALGSRSLPVVWILMVFSSWEISTPRVVQEGWNGPVLSEVRNNFGKLDYSKYPVCLSCDWVRTR